MLKKEELESIRSMGSLCALELGIHNILYAFCFIQELQVEFFSFITSTISLAPLSYRQCYCITPYYTCQLFFISF